MLVINKWGIIKDEPECYVLVLRGRVLTWHYKRSRKRLSPVPVGGGEYANLSPQVKMILKTKRRRKALLKELFSLVWRPRWAVSLVYPYNMAHGLTPDKLKSDLTYIGRKFRKTYPKGYLYYQIDYSGDSSTGRFKGAGIHLHLIGRCGRYSSKKKLPRFPDAMRQWWLDRVNSDRAPLVDVQNLRTKLDSYKACSYLLRGAKLDDHVYVTKFLGNRLTFDCFNKHNIRVAKCEPYDVSLEDFPEIRKLIAFDTHHASKRTSGSYQCDHESKVMNAGSGLHIISNPNLSKKIKRKLARLKKLEGGKR